jgi:serpin B
MRLLMRITFLMLTTLMAAALVGCGGDKVAMPKVKPHSVTPATLSERIAHNNEFAFKLYRELKSSDGNLIVSPHSISTCFGMGYAGARGRTEREIADVLCFHYPQEGFHSVLKELNDILNGRQGLTLKISNGCWGRQGLPYLSSYIDTLSADYGANMEYLDFEGRPEEARETINQWVEDHTEGYINSLLPPGSINWETYLVLANTVSFVAEWLHQFNPNYTQPSPFKRLDGSEVVVPIMFGEEDMPYCRGNGYLAMEMPYKGEQISMVLIMPDEGNYRAFEDGFTSDVLSSVISNLKERPVAFYIPKFAFYSSFDLGLRLQNMGMIDAFTPGVANFTGMDGVDDGSPWISLVVHKSYIMIDETGTKALAGTGMVFTYGISELFFATRPFIFVIRDIPTGTILFMGRVLDPSAT